ncbi:MAG TPA: 30S ribosomal protein S9 [Pirellulales bacterium]|jgi:small subunit ribosomal protein S9
MSTVETPAAAKKNNGDVLGTGRRKTSVARVRVRPGNGTVTINGRPLDHFFVREQDRNAVLAPLVQTDRVTSVDLHINVHGGGITGQAGACKLGIARALKKYDVTLEEPLRQQHMLTRDSRMKERKHYGLRGARRGTQFSKR